jgi:predicted amidohydrolase
MKLALRQGAGVPGDPGATVAEAAQAMDAAARGGADLLVFPEGFLTGYHIPGLAPGGLAGVEEALAQVGAAARAAGLAVVMGTHLDRPEGLRNAAVVFGPDGAELGRYHKRALFGDWEKATFLAGAAPCRVRLGRWRVGVLICYDVEFPELVRAEARAGVDLVVAPTALMAPHDRVARQVIPVRALENQIFLGYCNRAGAEPGLSYVGLSTIAGPRGETLAQAGPGEESGLIMADLDRARIARERAEASYLDDLAGLRGL